MSRDVEVPMGLPDHLPECLTHQERGGWCICPALRACEQRVDQAWHEYDQLAREGAYLSGLSAARDAVAALPKHPGYDLDDYTAAEAIAAIDALRLNTADCLCPSPNPDCQHPTCPREEK